MSDSSQPDTVQVKICGLKDPISVQAAMASGATYLGFVFYHASPRFVTAGEASLLAKDVPAHVKLVGVFVDETPENIASITRAVPLDMVQLHGHETPAQVAEIKAAAGVPVMKAFAIGSADDLDRIERFDDVADAYLLDAKAPVPTNGETVVPGGNGVSFDWNMLSGRSPKRPWFLSGGLTSANVRDALTVSGAVMIDASSGLERARGIKDPSLIDQFMTTVKKIEPSPKRSGE